MKVGLLEVRELEHLGQQVPHVGQLHLELLRTCTRAVALSSIS
jgi:hypothetical protein